MDQRPVEDVCNVHAGDAIIAPANGRRFYLDGGSGTVNSS